jgi:hypothetical protein
LGAWLLAAGTARAHHGYESEPQIRLLNEQTFVIVRMTVSVVDRLLDADVPAVWDDAAVSALPDRLKALTEKLVVITAAAETLRPSSARAALDKWPDGFRRDLPASRTAGHDRGGVFSPAGTGMHGHDARLWPARTPRRTLRPGDGIARAVPGPVRHRNSIRRRHAAVTARTSF